jgi:hypothetical protein
MAKGRTIRPENRELRGNEEGKAGVVFTKQQKG